jgi:hypothetical protein
MRPDNVLLNKSIAGPHIASINSSIITKYYENFIRNFEEDGGKLICSSDGDLDLKSKTKSVKNVFVRKTTKSGKDSNIKLLGLDFIFKDEMFQITERVYHPMELLILTKELFETLHAVNRKGYTSMDYIKSTFMVKIGKFLSGLGYEDKVLGNDENSYTMWYNTIFINYYYLILINLRTLRDNNVIEKDFIDSFEDWEAYKEDLINALDNARVNVLNRIDHFIRFQIQKRGVTLIQQTYSGFDTEFELLDEKRMINKLLSVQTAIQRQSVVKVPLYNIYNLAYCQPLTREMSEFYQPGINDNKGHLYTFTKIIKDSFLRRKSLKDGPTFDTKRTCKNNKGKVYSELAFINNSIKHTVSIIRNYLFNRHDESMKLIIDLLKQVSGVKFYEDKKHDQVVFTLPLTDERTWIGYPGNEGFSFLDLLEQSKDMSVDTTLSSLTQSKDLELEKFENERSCSSSSSSSSSTPPSSATESLSKIDIEDDDDEKDVDILLGDDYTNFERDPFDGELEIDSDNTRVIRKVKIKKTKTDKGKSKCKGKGKVKSILITNTKVKD